MVYFIAKENQDLLWNVAHRNSLIRVFLQQMNQDDKYTWFRNIIGIFYDKYGANELSMQQLQVVNKEIIIYMIQSIQQRKMDVHQNQQSQYIQTPPVPANTRQEEYTNEFELRQKEYQQMLDKKTPNEIDFKEDLEKDEPIQDMKALMQKHMQERENEISWQRENPVLTIDNSSNIIIETETIKEEKNNTKKSVTWEDDVDYQEKYRLLQENYLMLQEEYIQMKNKNEESI